MLDMTERLNTAGKLHVMFKSTERRARHISALKVLLLFFLLLIIITIHFCKAQGIIGSMTWIK